LTGDFQHLEVLHLGTTEIHLKNACEFESYMVDPVDEALCNDVLQAEVLNRDVS